MQGRAVANGMPSELKKLITFETQDALRTYDAIGLRRLRPPPTCRPPPTRSRCVQGFVLKEFGLVSATAAAKQNKTLHALQDDAWIKARLAIERANHMGTHTTALSSPALCA